MVLKSTVLLIITENKSANETQLTRKNHRKLSITFIPPPRSSSHSRPQKANSFGAPARAALVTLLPSSLGSKPGGGHANYPRGASLNGAQLKQRGERKLCWPARTQQQTRRARARVFVYYYEVGRRQARAVVYSSVKSSRVQVRRPCTMGNNSWAREPRDYDSREIGKLGWVGRKV